MAVRKLPKDVLKMASGLISPSGLAGHRRPLCIAGIQVIHHLNSEVLTVLGSGSPVSSLHNAQ